MEGLCVYSDLPKKIGKEYTEIMGAPRLDCGAKSGCIGRLVAAELALAVYRSYLIPIIE